ncbi:MAG: hypothetical protein CFH12_00669 [Alphaproteobacteria bacterium MarineAlpha5_Bin2]|jgi:uncharacterized membrane protein|nr:MAG: hypothetical protein CFH12_00669 [Alphaproteobacteria bacterium MarineAlpha5_Bin2]
MKKLIIKMVVMVVGKVQESYSRYTFLLTNLFFSLTCYKTNRCDSVCA